MGLKDVPPDNKENDANYCRYLAERMLSGKVEDAWALRHVITHATAGIAIVSLRPFA